MRVYVTGRGGGKSALLINRALYAADQNPLEKVVIVSVNQKRSSALKKWAMETNGGALPKNVEFVGADAFFSRNASRTKNKNTTRFFVDDVDDILKVMMERIVGGKVYMDLATATEDSKGK